MRWIVPSLLLVGAVSCGSHAADDADQAASAQGLGVDLRIVFVHGILGSDDVRKRAEGELGDLEKGVIERVNARGSKVRLATARVNLYTDESGALVSPGIDDRSDGTGLPSAQAWLSQLEKKTNLVFPNAKNIVFVGHSTGARTAALLAASETSGFRDRVAGVVTLHGMIDKLQTTDYDVVGPTSFITGCKVAVADGWCEYAGNISAVPALDWLARERHVLALIASASCSPSVWGGVNDRMLPLRAQGSPWVPGMMMTPIANQTLGPAHGTFYGEFCHSDITNTTSVKHVAAVAAASDAITKWLFDAAPRVVGTDDPNKPIDVASLDANQMSATFASRSACGDGRRSAGNPEVIGLCQHPGFFDGDDHSFSGDNKVEASSGPGCDGTVRVAHGHGGERHPMRVWMKRYSLPEGGGLVSTLR